MTATTILDRDHLTEAATRIGRVLGPQQHKAVKSEAEALALWARDLQAATEAGDVQRITALAGVIAKTAARIDATAARAARAK